MPMDFPDMKALMRAGEIWKFRSPNDAETEYQYRIALANFVEPKDFVESCEIRNKVGWDKFTKEQNKDMLIRKGFK
jgi:beta-galactosidase/beta-glucuronidase